MEGEGACAQPCPLPPAPPRTALRTGVSVGAGQAVSSHLRRKLVTTVQELLGAEHVAWVGNPVHAVQDVDLRREGLVGVHSSPDSTPFPKSPLLTTAPQLLLPHPPLGPGGLPAVISTPTASRFSPLHPGSSTLWEEGDSLGTSTMNSLLE